MPGSESRHLLHALSFLCLQRIWVGRGCCLIRVTSSGSGTGGPEVSEVVPVLCPTCLLCDLGPWMRDFLPQGLCFPTCPIIPSQRVRVTGPGTQQAMLKVWAFLLFFMALAFPSGVHGNALGSAILGQCPLLERAALAPSVGIGTLAPRVMIRCGHSPGVCPRDPVWARVSAGIFQLDTGPCPSRRSPPTLSSCSPSGFT